MPSFSNTSYPGHKTKKNIYTAYTKEGRKKYYKNELKQHKNDGKATWAILNQVIRKSEKQSSDCEYTYVPNLKQVLI